MTYHETLIQAKNLLRSGNVAAAKAIIKEHLDQEHNFESNFSELARRLPAYQVKLHDAYTYINSSNNEALLDAAINELIRIKPLFTSISRRMKIEGLEE